MIFFREKSLWISVLLNALLWSLIALILVLIIKYFGVNGRDKRPLFNDGFTIAAFVIIFGVLSGYRAWKQGVSFPSDDE
jgi:hypothetical protein